MKDLPSWRRDAINDLVEQNILRSLSVIAAMMKVPREEFLPSDVRDYAYADSPIPIGFGQTTSALHMTALLCEYSEMRLSQHVLEVGGGCGYMSCVYAEVVAASDQTPTDWGHVWTVEIVPGLAQVGKKNVERMGYAQRVTYIEGDASDGLDNVGSFDIILTTSGPGNPGEINQSVESRRNSTHSCWTRPILPRTDSRPKKQTWNSKSGESWRSRFCANERQTRLEHKRLALAKVRLQRAADFGIQAFRHSRNCLPYPVFRKISFAAKE